jgi:hypothetical protein
LTRSQTLPPSPLHATEMAAVLLISTGSYS